MKLAKLTAMATLPLLLPSLALAADGEGADPKEQMMPVWGSALFNLLMFLALFFVLAKFVWPKILEGIQAREAKIRSDLEHAEQAARQAEETLKEFARKTGEEMNIRLQGFETDYFIFCTDLPPREAKNWAGLLDKMYDRLCDMFAIERGTNVWRGKCLVFTFSRAADYRRYELQMEQSDPGGTVGRCHGFGDGMVRIAFYRQEDEMVFAHVLVHEAVHAFLHRYRSHRFVPSWANEGLAEVIGEELVPQCDQVELKEQQAIKTMGNARTVGANFFDARQIDFWQYGVASSLTKFLIRENRKGYVAFINGIKDGLPVDEALDQKYGAGKDRIIPAFGRWHNIDNLRYD